MRITAFFKKILKLIGTIVESAHVSSNTDKEKPRTIVIRVRPQKKNLRCGQCGRKAEGRHGEKGKLRWWRDLGIRQIPVYLVCRIYRVRCKKCGVKTMQVPWARVGSIFTKAFEDEVAWFMQKTNQSATARYFGISWTTAGKIIRRVVAEKLDGSLLENLRLLGVDEISYGRPRKFLTVVVDHQKHRVIWAAKGQSSETLADFFKMLGPSKCSAIEAISIDMDPAFEKAIRDHAPAAEIVYDRFHIVQLLSRATDEVRRQEVAQALPDQKRDLKNSRWPILKNPWNLTLSENSKLATIQQTNQRIYRAYLLKESFQRLFDANSIESAEADFNAWYGWARRSRLEPFKKLALTLRRHLPGILRFLTRNLTNSAVEGWNSKIRMISHRAFGFRSAEALIAMIKLNCSGIELSPIGY
ncbi:ISL3 family transposase [bacterium]|nr:ISL3 family transposase [bacterium]